MMKRTSQYLVPFVLGTMAAMVLFVSGCGEDEVRKPLPSKADPPSVYMKDAKFRKELDEKVAEGRNALGVREKLLAEMERRVDAMREKLQKEAAGRKVDDAAVKKELEKDPEWNSLVRRIEDATTAFNDSRAEATKVVARRLAARKEK